MARTNSAEGDWLLTEMGDYDPYLHYQPHFAFSLPIQILLNGIIVTLVGVLLIHLLFTAQYHWPLARLNFALQLSAVCTLLISLCASIFVSLGSVHHTSRDWPYMLEYIAVSIPPPSWSPKSWSVGEKTLWYMMQATTSGLAHITHIQFLTLLFPSKLEARLIFLLLGPLAIASSAMTFTSLSPFYRAEDLGDAVRGTCNTTLSLLFTAALFIWGFAVNRKRAWRTDGGTAAFGAAACLLAIMAVVVNFVLIFEDGLVWLPNLLWAVVLWQSFLGWWWWVGSGMGIGEVEDMLEKEQKKKESRRRKNLSSSSRSSKKRQQREGGTSSGTNHWFIPSGLSRRRRLAGSQAQAQDVAGIEDEHIEMSSFSPRGGNDPHPYDHDHDHDHEHDASTSTTTARTNISPFFRLPIISSIHSAVVSYFKALRREHRNAATAQVLEGVGVIGGSGGASGGVGSSSMSPGGRNAVSPAPEGWGLGNFGLKEREEAERRIRMFKEERRRRALIGSGADEEADEHEAPDDESGEDEDVRDEDERARRRELRETRERLAYPTSTSTYTGSGSGSGTPSRSRTRRPQSRAPREDEDDAPLPRESAPSPSLPDPLPPPGSVFWWWGPLRRWRLQDRTVYS